MYTYIIPQFICENFNTIEGYTKHVIYFRKKILKKINAYIMMIN